jgi:hypothetical protein
LCKLGWQSDFIDFDNDHEFANGERKKTFRTSPSEGVRKDDRLPSMLAEVPAVELPGGGSQLIKMAPGTLKNTLNLVL